MILTPEPSTSPDPNPYQPVNTFDTSIGEADLPVDPSLLLLLGA